MDKKYTNDEILKFLNFLNSYIKDYELNYEPYFKEKLNDKQKLLKEHYNVYKNLIPLVQTYLRLPKTYDNSMSIDNLEKHFLQRLKNNKMYSIKYNSPQSKQIIKEEYKVVNTALYILQSLKND